MGAVALFSFIGIMALLKKKSGSELAERKEPLKKEAILSVPAAKPGTGESFTRPTVIKGAVVNPPPLTRPVYSSKEDFPHIDRIFQLFNTEGSKLPVVETLTYSSTVPWLKGRPAWIADYAAYYTTSRHFIARSLNGKPDYTTQKVMEESKFNVFRKDKKIEFHLLVDVMRCKMGFYYVDLDTNERVLLKTYSVGLGRIDPSKPSGTLTPLGRYKLGNRVAIYQPGMMGFYQDQKVEMIRVFGTRWIPLEPVDESVLESKGYGLQGAPWMREGASLTEKKEVVGAYDSDGCIRLNANDIEEIFSIVLTKPTWVEIVKDFHGATLPGIEVATPSR